MGQPQTPFEKTVWPHLSGAYNVAFWLTRNAADAEDVVQEATLRAFRFFDGYRGGDARSWFFTIVRNTGYTWLRQHRGHETAVPSEELVSLPDNALSPEGQALRDSDQAVLAQALGELPLEFREILVLRELEGLSYKEIGVMTGVPMGTVMSRLARARTRLLQALNKTQRGEIQHGL